MKKILTVLFTVILMLTFVVALYIYNFAYYENELYTGKTTISVVTYDETTVESFHKEVNVMCEKHDIVFSKYVFLDRTNISVFTTAPLSYPSTNRGEYDQLLLPMNTKSIRIMSMDKMRETSGCSGLYYINSVDNKIVDAVVEHFNKAVGETEVYASYATKSNSWISAIQEAEAYFPVLILLVVSGLIALFVIVKIAISESKTIAILRVNGYTNKRIFAHVGCRYYGSVLWSLSLSAAFLIAGLITNGNLKFLFTFLAIDIFACILLTCIGAAVFLIAIKIIDQYHRKADIIKGHTANRFLLILQFALKYAMIAFAAVLFISLSGYQAKINTYMSSDESWFQAENIFRIRASFVTNDLAEKRKLELRAKELYQELEENLGVFLIRTANYETLSSGQRVWEANVEEFLYSSSGRSITVNLNYLKRNPILDIDGNSVADKIIVDDFVRNILIPVSLREHESEILEGFLTDFKFQKIEVPQIYERDIGEEIVPIDGSKLKINLIYVKDGTNYFTYDKQTMSEHGNLITDPMVVVDTGNVDPSFYYSWLSNSVYFESLTPEPIEDISPTVAKHDLLSSYNSIESIYDTRAEEMQSLAEAKTMTIFVMAMILFLLVFFIYLLSHSYFEQNKYAIFIKYISGYSLIKICGVKLIFEILLDILVVSICGNFTIAAIIVSTDIVLTYIFSLILYKSSAVKVIKGGLM